MSPSIFFSLDKIIEVILLFFETNLQTIWNNVPLKLRDRLEMGRKVNGDYSVHKGGYRPLRKIGKFVKNHIPMELRDEFIQEFVTKDLDYFNSKSLLSTNVLSFASINLFCGFLDCINLEIILKVNL